MRAERYRRRASAEEVEVLGPGHVDRAQRAQVRRRPLHVEQRAHRRGGAARPWPSTRPSTRRSPRWNIDSPANNPPMRSPYSPPTSSPSRHTSTLCAQPSSCSRVYASTNDSSIQPCGRRGSAHAAHHRLERGVDPDLEARDRASAATGSRGSRRAGSRPADRATTTRARPRRASGTSRAGTRRAPCPARGRRRPR